MTSEIILDYNGSNQLTVYTTKVEEVVGKTLIILTTPGETTKIVDLVIKERRFNVDGFIDFVDRTKVRNLVNVEGTFIMRYGGTSPQNHDACIEKYMITEDPSDSGAGSDPVQLHVKFTVIEGVNYNSQQ